MVAEFENRKTRQLGYTVETLGAYLRAQGYVLLVSEWHPIIEYGTKHRWKCLHQREGAVDEDGWGNLIAVGRQDERALRRLAGAVARQLQARRAMEHLVMQFPGRSSPR